MLSYRHGFHAGNHADVLKHTLLVFLLGYLSRKDKPWWFVDTHAGAAQYDLESEWARKNAEHESGIARLWHRTDLPPALGEYVDHVRRVNDADALR
ncbi:MAG: 23S rRNA (adenine(2030)-N(6))-methyltransferase RlmJ, partial [Gammaproteobacteria bacterium]|nr:23S rRNA (adenine(2030)-N(6))-methyltransferase RlmJ [Gammaproteobacteria bacterium]